MPSMSGALAVVALVVFAVPTAGNVFLGAHPKSASKMLTKEFVRQTFASELAMLTSHRTREIEEDLRPIYLALPKNEYGNLAPSTVLYAVFRYFNRKYGWRVEGLLNSEWNESQQIALSVENIPSYISNLLEERVHGHGLTLQEVAVFAATLSDLVRNEAVQDFIHLFEQRGMSTSDRLTPSEMDMVMDAFLVAYIHGVHADGNLDEMRQQLKDTFFAWHDTEMFGKDLRKDLEWARRSQRNPFVPGASFDDLIELSEEFVHTYGSFTFRDCRSLKERLVEMELSGTGRVSLSDFYGGFFRDNNWPFTESHGYLQSLGAIDDSVRGKPTVIIPNYMNSLTNCLSPSDFYSVCCLNECEDLQSKLERSLAEPAAPAGRIADFISGLPSDTVNAPRNLSTQLIARLEEIAKVHDGRVPLHGRLFAQWMHHAYPRECPFPHVSGTTLPLLAEHWEAVYGTSTVVKPEDVRATQGNRFDTVDGELPWLTEEELISTHKAQSGTRSEPQRVKPLRFLVFLGAVVSLGLSAARTTKAAWGGKGAGNFQGHLV